MTDAQKWGGDSPSEGTHVFCFLKSAHSPSGRLKERSGRVVKTRVRTPSTLGTIRRRLDVRSRAALYSDEQEQAAAFELAMNDLMHDEGRDD